MKLLDVTTLTGVPVRLEVVGLDTAEPELTFRVSCRRCGQTISERTWDTSGGIPGDIAATGRQNALLALTHECGGMN